jgi:hypothetical protein
VTNGPDREAHVRHLYETAWEMLAPGFHQHDEVVESLTELVTWDEDSPLGADDVEAAVGSLWARRQAELAVRPPRVPTDDVRLSDAFAELTRRGIVASINLGGDQDDGSHLSRELTAARPGARGYAFCHEQDVNRLAYPDPVLYIGFDAVGAFADRDAYDEAARVVGAEIVTALTAYGLRTEWNGSPAARIQVLDLVWRRPLP